MTEMAVPDNDYDKPGGSTPLGPHRADGIGPAKTPPGPPGGEVPRSRLGGRRRLVAGLAMAALGVMTVGAWVVANNQPEDAGTTEAAQPVAREPDETPAIDETAIGAYREVPLFSPAEVPPGFKLVAAEVQDRVEGGGCPEVVLLYEDPSAPVVADDGSLGLDLELTIGLPECRTDLGGEEDNLPYTAGEHRGSFERADPVDGPGQNYNYTFVHLTIDGAAVEVTSNLPDDAITAAVASLRPFVLANEPVYHQRGSA